MPPLRLGTPGSPPCPHFHPQWGLRPEPDCLRSQGHGTILAGGEGTVTAAQGRLSLPRGGGAPPVMPTQAPPVGILSCWEQACWWKVLGEQPLPAPREKQHRPLCPIAPQRPPLSQMPTSKEASGSSRGHPHPSPPGASSAPSPLHRWGLPVCGHSHQLFTGKWNSVTIFF